MGLKTNYQKLRGHLKSGGLFYAVWRGIKYFVFLVKKQRDKFKLPSENMIGKGRTKIICSKYGINIFWNEVAITKGAGLNAGINALGLWTDSAKADWRILEKGNNHLKLKVIFRDLPLNQTWDVEIKDEHEICWQIDMDVEEWLHTDEFRIVCLVNPCFKSWINNYQQGDFPRRDNHWQNLCASDIPTSLVGVRFPLKDEPLPSFILEPKQTNMLCLVQNPPLNTNAHIIGLRHIVPEERKDYSPGSYHLFSGKINLFEDEYLLDVKIESLRRDSLEKAIGDKIKYRKSKRKLKVLLTNLPWQRQGKWGVRAGSRWPHIKDDSEGDYLPFPFFLAYATSFLQKHNIDALMIDAIAEQITEDQFLEKISRIQFDYLVAETSTPSFYDDLNILKKISRAGIPIILSGPNPEIYDINFLKEHSFIDFVLYGEYEFTLLELIKSLQENKNLSKIHGLIYRQRNEIIKNYGRQPFDINLLPWPHRETLPMERYWDLPGNISYPSVQMLASRGCPFGCNFCLWPQVLYKNGHYRTRDIEDVVNEMEYLVRKKKFKSVYFDDDTFNIGKERMLKFCKLIKERKLQNIPWAIMARPDLMDEEILTEMKSAGLWAVKYGVESCIQSFVENCHKNLDLERTTEIIKLTKESGIKFHLTFTFGFSGETKETIQRTIDYGLSLDPESVQFSILTPFPGTRLFEDLDRQGRILTRDWSKYDGHHHCVFEPDNLKPEDLVEAKKQAYRIWGEHLRKKRGFRGNVRRFRDYWHKYGFKYAMYKTFDYLGFIWFKRKKYLNG